MVGENFSPPPFPTNSGSPFSQVKVTEDVHKCVAELGIAEEEALKRGTVAKSKEFVEKGAEVYAKA